MAEDDLRARKAVEQAAEDQAQGVGAGLEPRFPGGAPQAGIAVKRTGGRQRIGGMNVNRRAEGLRPLPERMERGVVEVLAVGMAVDHGPAELQLVAAALQFVGGGDGIL